MPRSSKGSAFERRLCKLLSEWWTRDDQEPRSDVFWRTPASGARATARSKNGRATRNHHGDVLASDPVGQPFLDLVCLEVKRGYSRFSVADLLDKPARAKEQVYEKWFKKAEETRKQAGARFWLVVVQRDRREPLVFVPMELGNAIVGLSVDVGGEHPHLCLSACGMDVCGLTLAEFLEVVGPEQVRGLLKG